MNVGRASQNAMTWRRRRLPDTHDDVACANRGHMLENHMGRAIRELRMVHRSINLAQHSFLGSPLNLTMPGFKVCTSALRAHSRCPDIALSQVVCSTLSFVAMHDKRVEGY